MAEVNNIQIPINKSESKPNLSIAPDAKDTNNYCSLWDSSDYYVLTDVKNKSESEDSDYLDSSIINKVATTSVYQGFLFTYLRKYGV